MKNKMYWLMIVVMCVSLFGSSPQTARAQGETPVPFHTTQEVKYVPGEVIVVFEKDRVGASEEMMATAESIAGALSGEVLEVREDAFLMKVDENTDIQSFTADFETNIQSALPGGAEGIAFTQPNYIFDLPEPGGGTGGDVTPDNPLPNGEEEPANNDELKKLKTTTILPTYPEDPLLFNTWGWWDASTDVVWQEKSVAPTICLLDTGADIDHPDLKGNVLNGKDLVNNDPIPDDDNGHGTHVAGVLAAKANNKIGMAGMSNGKVIVYKVLNSVGSGDTWDIAEGIVLCANNAAVKVINMSLGGGYPDEYMYWMLDYAIYTKGKLVVAAAGNASTSEFSFPAAWAGKYVCVDGAYFTNATTECSAANYDPNYANWIWPGMISVGASRSYWSSEYDGYSGGSADGYLWVDTNGNNVEDGNELFYMSQCAAYFSNFGAWVNIVAPGENVTSTVPVTYPFNEQYTWGADPDGDGYDTWDGTSMATPFVAGAAARLWSVGAKLFGTAAFTNYDIKAQLLNSAYTVTTAMDPNQADITWGYDEYGNTFTGEAPYCWPDASDGVLSNTANARVLNLADAMERTSLYAYIFNATNGLPLRGAMVGAYSGTALVSAGMVTSNTSPLVVLPNIPRDKTYDIKVTKSGFTSGAASISILNIPANAYAYVSHPSVSVSIPPTGKIDGVIDWIVNNDAASDLDMYVWLPEDIQIGVNHYVGGVVGCCLGTTNFIGNGRLIDYPFARWNHDGGVFDWQGTESVTIMPKPGAPTVPYFNVQLTDFYDFIVYEWEDYALNENDIYFRLWTGGKVKTTVVKSDVCDTNGTDNIMGNSDDETWWEPGYMFGSTFTYSNQCGTGQEFPFNGGLWPYTSLRHIGAPNVKPKP